MLTAKVPIAACGAVAALSLGLIATGCGGTSTTRGESAPADTVRQAAGTMNSNTVSVRNNLPTAVTLSVDRVTDGDWKAGGNPGSPPPQGLQGVEIAPGGRYRAELGAWYTEPPATWELTIARAQTGQRIAQSELVAWWREANVRGGVSLVGFIPAGAPENTGPHVFPTVQGVDETVTVRLGISSTAITIGPAR